jgi:hypothetical protein
MGIGCHRSGRSRQSRHPSPLLSGTFGSIPGPGPCLEKAQSSSGQSWRSGPTLPVQFPLQPFDPELVLLRVAAQRPVMQVATGSV